MLLLIDNYDSFTWNLRQYFAQLGQSVTVVRNDCISLSQIAALKPERIVISPGPGTPDDAGISLALVEHFAGKLPILGICLGHQTIAQVFAGKIVKAERPMHGKQSSLIHTQQGLFKGLPDPLSVTRYHSLVVDPSSLDEDFDVDAWTVAKASGQREIMAIRHRAMPLWGVQFHPESIMTEFGHELLANFLLNQ